MSNNFDVELEVLSVGDHILDDVYGAMLRLKDAFSGDLKIQSAGKKFELRDFLLRFKWQQSGSEDDVLTTISQQAAQQLPAGTAFKVGALCTDNLPWECSDFKVTKNRKARLL